MSNLENIILPVADFIKRYRSLKTVKIKFIFGKYTEFFGFDDNILNKDHYYELENIFDNSDKFESAKNLKFISKKSNIIDKIIIICKTGPYDILVTAEIEDKDYIYDLEKSISGKCYNYKNHSFNIIISDNMGQKNYKMFIHAHIPKDYTDIYISHSSLLKIQDIINICFSPEEPLLFTILQKNK
tara:strand:- start:1425 stop:1979 length:555 start_codon:yes stop_codon:yes gene_type:complete